MKPQEVTTPPQPQPLDGEFALARMLESGQTYEQINRAIQEFPCARMLGHGRSPGAGDSESEALMSWVFFLMNRLADFYDAAFGLTASLFAVRTEWWDSHE
jgi:hypothetical protein